MKPKALLFLLIIATTLTTRLTADSIEVSGTVSGTWAVDTVHVTGNIQIREVESLEILPGTLVLFHGEFYFDVEGSLRAMGTANEPVYFTTDDTTGFHNDTIPRGGWNQIRIENVPSLVDSTIFTYCDFSFGKAVSNDSIHGYGGAICIRNVNKVRIQHCSFYSNYAFYNGGAVYLENASVSVKHNHFELNSCGQQFDYYGYGGGICTDWGEPVITQNHFTLNSSTGIAGGLCVRFRDCMVSHNVFDNNFSALGGGFGILHIDSCHYVISNNLLINNGAEFFGAGISNNDCSPTYVNNTICNNHCIGGGGGFYCKDSVVPVLYNNILYGNTQYGGESNQVYLWDLLAQPDFYHNNVEGGFENFAGTGGSAFSGAYENNLDEIPGFIPGNYNLEPGSPCINSGCPDTTGLMVPASDLAGLDRIVDGTIDMGAYENQNPISVSDFSGSQLFLSDPKPNPAKYFTKFSITFAKPQHINIEIVNNFGQTIERIADEFLKAGKHTFTWEIREGLPPGNYVLIINAGQSRHVKKIIVD